MRWSPSTRPPSSCSMIREPSSTSRRPWASRWRSKRARASRSARPAPPPLIHDASKDARYKATGPERRAKTVLAAPLRAQDNLLGAMVLVRAAREPFGPEHQKLVEAIATQAAVAIDHARLFETERASRRRAEALLATAQAGSEAGTTTGLLQRAVKQVAFAMRATAAAVYLPDEEGEIIEAVFDAAAPPAFGLEALRR